MGNFRFFAAFSILGALTCSAAYAGTPVITTGASDTTAGIGLRFEFGDNEAEIVGSARHTYTNTANTVTGGLVEIAIPVFSPNGHGPKVRAMGLAGTTAVQGQVGVGYDFGHQQALLGFGVQGPYVEGGVNYLFDGAFHPYLGVNTYSGAPSSITSILIPP